MKCKVSFHNYNLDDTISSKSDSAIETRFLFFTTSSNAFFSRSKYAVPVSVFNKLKYSDVLMEICNWRDFENNFLMAVKNLHSNLPVLL
ncbi:MAG: hypothetical protein ABI266_04460 [Ginsengibacter sp.]